MRVKRARLAGLQTKRPPDAPDDVGLEDRVIAPDIVPMSERSVERSSLAEVLVPSLRIVATWLHIFEPL